jgi:glutamine amidotransferase
MCLIIVCPPGQQPTIDTLLDTIISNPHGSGWMMKIGDNLEIVKAVDDIDHVLGTWLEAREANPDVYAVWHSRVATQGKHTDNNCHPFNIPGKKWGMAHNGIMNLADPPRPDQMKVEFWKRDVRSDSRVLAEDYMPRWTWQEIFDAKEDWEFWLGKRNKVVLLNPDPGEADPIIILNERSGVWYEDDNCWYSHEVGQAPKRDRKDVPGRKKVQASGGEASGGECSTGLSTRISKLDAQMAANGLYPDENGVYVKRDSGLYTKNNAEARRRAAQHARSASGVVTHKHGTKIHQHEEGGTPHTHAKPRVIGSDDGGNVMEIYPVTTEATIGAGPTNGKRFAVGTNGDVEETISPITTGGLVRSSVDRDNWMWDEDPTRRGYL